MRLKIEFDSGLTKDQKKILQAFATIGVVFLPVIAGFALCLAGFFQWTDSVPFIASMLMTAWGVITPLVLRWRRIDHAD